MFHQYQSKRCVEDLNEIYYSVIKLNYMDLWNIDTFVAFGSQLKARDEKLIINSTKKMEGESLAI